VKKTVTPANGKRRRSAVELDSDALDESDEEVTVSTKRATKKRVVSKEIVIELPRIKSKTTLKVDSRPSVSIFSRKKQISDA
jgi:hypothetical protein